jgi:hypothetical protein
VSESPTHLPHACPQIVAAIADSRVPLTYLPRVREYGLDLEGGVAIQEIYFCPFCGTKLPGSLRDAWFERLDELALEPEAPQLPIELQSDAWWRDAREFEPRP